MEQEKLLYEEENEAKINALSALAETASSLSRAVNKIAAYVPTQWVDNSEPSINATRLMHIENGIRDATAAVNNAIDAVTANSTAINKINSDLTYQIYVGDWNDMPTGIWEIGSNNPNSPEGNDGHYYRVFCKSGEFQQAYRIASDIESSLAYFRYRSNGIWKNWYKPYVTTSDFNINVYGNSNLNNIIQNGLYWVENTTNETLNFPEDSINGWLQVIHIASGNAVKQIFWRYGTKNTTGNVFYMRNRYTDGWSNWVKFAGSSV